MPIRADVQRLASGNIVELFDLDCTRIGGGIFRFTPGNLGWTNVRWRGNEYIPMPITASGFEKSGRGTLPTPSLTIAAEQIVIAASIAMDNLRGAKVTRWKTFEHYLDGMPQADPNQHFPIEIWRVERLRRHSTADKVIEWELSASLDQEGKKIPGRVISQLYCPWIYRRWSGAGFDYAKVDCPYSGGQYFTQDDKPTTPDKDRCSKRVSGCELRFGAGRQLPFGGFPGAGRARV